MSERQANIFDAHLSEAAREEAIRRADFAAEEGWKMNAMRAIEIVARRRALFTTDAVWYVLERLTNYKPHEPRALGALMRKAVKQELIKPTDEHRMSTRVACHRRPLRVWQSRLK